MDRYVWPAADVMISRRAEPGFLAQCKRGFDCCSYHWPVRSMARESLLPPLRGEAMGGGRSLELLCRERRKRELCGL